MKLTVLGGSAACPGPGQGASSYLVEAQSQRWLLDCGPNTLLELRKHVEIEAVDGVIISHMHSDHTLDLVPLRYGLKYDPTVNLTRLPKLHLPPGGREQLNRLANAFAIGTEPAETFFEEVFAIDEYDPSSELRSGPVSVTFLLTNHPVACWAVRMSTPGGVLVYLADTGPMDGLVDFARNADILICEGTYPDAESAPDVPDRPHLTAAEAGAIGRASGARHLVLTHLWSTIGLDGYRVEASREFGRDVIVATPGLQATPIDGQVWT
jgi:ribonuclease BN (tRNA processing enzyme)